MVVQLAGFMAGYSGTPLPKKLGIKPNLRVAFSNVPADVSSELKTALAGCTVVRDGQRPLDFAFLFVKSQADLKPAFATIARKLAPAGVVWIAWPKKTSGIASDLNENDVRKIGLEIGLVDVKVCAVNETWSGLKFVIRLKDRPART
jgi:hypothetical protein